MGQSASKQKFRESVLALIQIDVNADDSDFWDELWKIPASAEEVFELISSKSARKLRDERFINLATLFTQAVAQMCQIVETPYNIYFDQALNCVRVLTRILPFLLEKGDLGDADENVEQLCWGTGNHHGLTTGEDEKIGLMVGGMDNNQNNTDGTTTATATNNNNDNNKERQLKVKSDQPDEQEPLALLVIHATMHMLFLPQFTCDYYEDSSLQGDSNATTNNQKQQQQQQLHEETKEEKDLKAAAGLRLKRIDMGVSLLPTPTSIIWAPGVGVTLNEMGYDAGTRKYDKNRIEVLRLLLASCCDPLFAPADEYNPLSSRWLAVATAADAPNAICLFYSLLNTILQYDPRAMTVQVTTTGFSTNVHVKLVELSAQVLCILLDCGLPGRPDPIIDQNNNPCVSFDMASKGGFNIFRTLLCRIDKTSEMTYIYNGFARLLRNCYESESTYNITGNNKLDAYQELLVLFWKFLEENPLFMTHILTRCNINEIIVPICFLMYKSRRDPSQIGLVHICTFILLKMSGERSLGVSLNKPFLKKLPTDLPLFSGCHSDLLTITLHKLVVNGAYKLVPLYSCFLTIIANISPYWKSMSLVTAVKLVNLFELFSSPKFLYSGEHAHRHLSLLLEVFNNIIQYQYHGNSHLVYAIVRRKDAFGSLASLTLEKAQSQCFKIYGDHTTVTKNIDNTDNNNNNNIPPPSPKGPVQIDSKGIPQMGVGGSGNNNNNNNKKDATTFSDSGSSVVGIPFHPTAKWLEELKESLPMETVSRLLQHLVPVVDEIVAGKLGIIDEQEILSSLNEMTMVGLLPVPHPIVIRKYQPNQYTALWFTAFMWGVIFLRNQSLPLFDGQCIELFQVSLSDDDDD